MADGVAAAAEAVLPGRRFIHVDEGEHCTKPVGRRPVEADRALSSAEPVSDHTIAARLQHLATAAPYFQPAHFDATFETGLEILLAALNVRAKGETNPLDI